MDQQFCCLCDEYRIDFTCGSDGMAYIVWAALSLGQQLAPDGTAEGIPPSAFLLWGKRLLAISRKTATVQQRLKKPSLKRFLVGLMGHSRYCQ